MIKDVTIENYQEHLDKIEKLVNNYKTLAKILDVNTTEYCTSHKQVLERYGEELAKMYNETPNDPQCDYQFKCWFHDWNMALYAYDENGELYIAPIK